MSIELKRLEDGDEIKSDDLVKQIYNIAVEDRERALKTYTHMKEVLDNCDRPSGIMFQELNNAQTAIRMATDKLVQVANLVHRKESTKEVNKLNLNFDKALLEDENKTSIDRRIKDLGVNEN